MEEEMSLEYNFHFHRYDIRKRRRLELKKQHNFHFHHLQIHFDILQHLEVNLVKLKHILLTHLKYIQMHKMLKLYQLGRILLLHHLNIQMDKQMGLILNLEHKIHFHCYDILNCKLLEQLMEHNFHIHLFFIQMDNSQLLVDLLYQLEHNFHFFK